MTWFNSVEFLSFVAEIVGIPLAIVAFVYENRKERQNEDEELNQRLSDEYTSFLKLVLENSDLHLLRDQNPGSNPLTEEQQERQFILFNILISLFERAYIVVYEPNMNKQMKRIWSSWEDYMREWCNRKDFRANLPKLLEGEDKEFQRHILQIANPASKQPPAPSTT